MIRRAVLLFVVGLLSAYHFAKAMPDQCEYCPMTHREITSGSAQSPYRYRVLSAGLVDVIASDQSDSSIRQGYLLAHLIIIPLMLASLYAYFRLWLNDDRAMIGTLIVALYLPLMFEIWSISLYDALQIIFLCAGLGLLKTQPRFWQLGFAILIVIATLNRETAVLLPLSVIAPKTDRRKWLYFAFFLTLWAVVYLWLRNALGSAPDAVPIGLSWKSNMAMLNHSLFNQALFVPVWTLYIYKLRHADRFHKYLILVVAFYAVLLIPFSLWNEVRLLLPLFVFTIPVVLHDPQNAHDDRAGAGLDDCHPEQF